MNKCSGCGAYLQVEDSTKEGYTINIDNNLCERCFRIKNYNEYKFINKDNNDFVEILKKISNTKDLVILVVDLFNINNNLEDIKKYLKNDILLVLTKRDLLPLSVYDLNLLNYFDEFNLNIKDKIIISSAKNYNFDELIEKINYYKKSNNVYVVGYTNAGKSTMINKLIYNYSDYTSSITTSNLPSTTLNSIEIKLNDTLTLIDTPGLIDNTDIINFIDGKILKKIIPSKEIKPITYQIKCPQYFNIDDLVILECDEYNSLTFYFSNKLNINRKFKKYDAKNLIRHDICVGDNCDIVINGLGFIKVVKKSKIIVYTLEGVCVYTRKSLI